mgnify:CR=1 FL=1
MITWFIPYKNIIPDDYVSSIFDIDYNKLYSNGKRLILTDLDNTLISYKATEPTDELYKWKSELEGMGFEIIIVSNSGKKRVKHFANMLGIKYVNLSTKPLKRGFKKASKELNLPYNELAIIGDQIFTDIIGGNRCKMYTILVEPISTREMYITAIKRGFENKIIKQYMKKHKNKKEG